MIPVLHETDHALADPYVSDLTSVVLVDDDPDFRWVVRQALERTGEFTVAGEAPDGATGVQAVAALCPDIVLLDIEMPRMDGLEALSILTHRCPGSSVVMLTALSSSAQLDAALRGGAVGIIRKGSSLANIVAQLRGLVGLAEIPGIDIEGVR